MNIFTNESGVSKLTVLMILVVLGLGFSEGIKYLRVQLHYQSMRDAMTAKAAAAQAFKDEEIRLDLEAKAIENGLPLKRDQFQLVRDEEKRTMTIKTVWQEEVLYLWGICGDECTQTYRFEVVANEIYSGK